MGVWGEIMEVNRRSYKADNEARLAGLVADRVAGKAVSNREIAEARWLVDLDQQWLDARARDRQTQALADAGAMQARQLQQAQREEAIRTQRAAEQEARAESRKALEEEVREAAEAYEQAIEAFADSLSNILADNGDISEELARTMLLHAIRVLPARQVELLGPEFAAAHAWVVNAEDPSGFFSMSHGADKLDPDDFDSEEVYRIAVASPLAGKLLELALKPWSYEDRVRLDLEYDCAPWSPLKDSSYPVTIAGKDVYCGLDSRRGRVHFSRLDEENWQLLQWLVAPMPTALSGESMENFVTSKRGRSAPHFGFDQTGTYLFLSGTLYTIRDGILTQSAKIDLRQQPQLALGWENEVLSGHGSFSPELQLISLKDGTPVLLTVLEAFSSIDGKRVSKGKFLVGIDLRAGKLLWKTDWGNSFSTDAICDWVYDAERECLIYHCTEREAGEARPPEKQGFFARLARPAPADAPKPVSIHKLLIRDAHTAVINQQAVIPASESDLVLDLVGDQVQVSQRKYGVKNVSICSFNLVDNTFTDTVGPGSSEENIPGRRLGSCRLHAIRQLLRFYGRVIDWRGQHVEPDARLVSTR